jgi:hypothetical protein
MRANLSLWVSSLLCCLFLSAGLLPDAGAGRAFGDDLPPLNTSNGGSLNQAAPPQGGGAQLGEANMATANQAAAEVLRSRMEDQRPQDFAYLSRVEKADVIVIAGSMDRVQDVLRAVEVPHLVVEPQDLDKVELSARQLVMVNCPGTLSDAGIEKLRKFVNAGGFLYTTDWALANVVEKAFPGFIAYNGRPTSNDVVEVQVIEQDSAFLTHLKLSDGDNPKWWLEGSSYPIRVVNRSAVQVLIGSKEMGERYGDSPIAVTFPYGDGRVLHIASHFYLQQNELRTARDKIAGSDYIEGSSLPAAAVQKLQGSAALKSVTAGDLQSAYSTQQMTTNLIVERKKDQKRVDGLYNNQAAAPVSINGKSTAEGEKLRVLETKDDKTRVRTMSGDEDWIDSQLVK